MCYIIQITHTLSGANMDEQKAIIAFSRQKIIIIEQLVDLLQCSTITARRRLKIWNTYTSINKNGRYYTLPQVPTFDENGLWKYQSVLFSKHGNLKQTIIWLIQKAQPGLSAGEIAKIVGLAPTSSFFTKLKTVAGINREKHHGRFIYFSGSSEDFHRQKHKRLSRQVESGDLPTDAEAVVILVALIKHPGIAIEKLTVKVQEKEMRVDSTIIRNFLESHDLLKKIADTVQYGI